jgi:hypothetical protein
VLLSKARMMVMIVRCAGNLRRRVIPVSAMTCAENVGRFGHVFMITGVSVMYSAS